MAKTSHLVIRTTEKQKNSFKRAVAKQGWKDMSALLTSVVVMITDGDLILTPPEPQKPTITVRNAKP